MHKESMTKEQQELKARFLEPETRDGYFIDADIKLAWKEMLDITEEVVRICDENGLNYSLAGGTLLGAVRHKGFIPWDDDIDIDMPRPDYDKLIALLGAGVLRKPYVLQTFVSDPGRVSTFAQVRNPNTTEIDPGSIKDKQCFNMGIGIDIFPIDGVPEGRWNNFVTKLMLRMSAGVMLRYVKPKHSVGFIGFMKYLLARTIVTIFGRKSIWQLRECAFRRNDWQKCKECGEFAFRMDTTTERWSPKVYNEYLTVPFEYLNLKIVSGYDEYLTNMYGSDWRTPKQVSGIHQPLVLDVHRSYKEVLVEKFGYKPEWVMDLP